MKLRAPGLLPLALGLSVAAHGVLLAVHFVDAPSMAHRLQNAPMDIVLVNAAGGEKPDKAVAIAQKSMAGGGGADQGRATSPLPRAAFAVEGDAAEDARRRSDSTPSQPIPSPTTLVSQQRSAATVPPPVSPSPPPADAGETGAQEEDRRRQLVDQLAEIERRLNRDNQRPRKRYVSPATREAAYAGYVDGLRRRIEAHGTRHFPELAGKKLYGELTLLVTIDAEGRLLGTDIVQGSGNAALDRRAQAIVRGIGGFGRFSEAMRRQADQIVLPSRFRFTRDQVLEAQPNG